LAEHAERAAAAAGLTAATTGEIERAGRTDRLDSDGDNGLAVVSARFSQRWPAVIECGPGWHPIVAELDRQIAAADPAARYCQIKEKFGGLRVYLAGAETQTVEALIRAAEAQAARTCEACGEPGTLRGDRSYIQTLCDRHGTLGQSV
jgi:hypothetical protein